MALGHSEPFEVFMEFGHRVVYAIDVVNSYTLSQTASTGTVEEVSEDIALGVTAARTALSADADAPCDVATPACLVADEPCVVAANARAGVRFLDADRPSRRPLRSPRRGSLDERL